MASNTTMVVTATATNTGAITFPAFDQAPRGTVLQGTVSIPTAPISAQFSAVVQSLTIGTFAGFNPWGPIQVGQGRTLQITGTGLTANTLYVAVWIVGQYPEGTEPAPPIPYGSVTQINNTSNNPVQVQILQLPAPPAAVNFSENLAMTGSAQTLTGQALTVGLAFLSDTANAAKIYVGPTNVSTGSAYLAPGQGVVLPVSNSNLVAVLGTSGDHLSIWGA